MVVLVFFFFKQKTAYEMRISDWSSDVCSSDLRARNRHAREAFVPLEDWDAEAAPEQENALVASDTLRLYEAAIAGLPERTRMEIGRASCRARVCPDV